MSLCGVSLSGLAASFGTPSTVVEVGEFRQRCGMYRHAFRNIDVAFTGGSLLAHTTASVLVEEGLSLGVYCDAQLATALAAQFPVDQLVVYGDAGRGSLLGRAVSLGVGLVVVDSLADIDRLGRVSRPDCPQRVSMSMATGGAGGVSDLAAHPRRSRGFSIGSDAAQAVRRILTYPGLKLVGVQCRIDSPIGSVPRYVQAAREGLEFAGSVRTEFGIEFSELRLGGGHDAVDEAGDQQVSCEYGAALARRVAQTCLELHLSAPHLAVEPGRPLIGPAALTLCRVVRVHRYDGRTVVEVDDRTMGFAPPAHRDPSGSVHVLSRLSAAADVHVEIVAAGSFRHEGLENVTIHDTLLPADIAEGDLLAVPSTGNALHTARAHRSSRHALVAVSNGRVYSMVPRRRVEPVQPRRAAG